MSTTLPLFWNLSSASKKERIDSSVKLVSALEQFQAQFSNTSEVSEGDDEEDQVDPLDKYNAQDVSYSIRRLIRGLASPRESSRLGFSVALTELLSKITTITCSQILSLIMSSTKITKAISGQEERDILFARLFGITAIIQSGLLVRTDPLSQSPSSSTDASSLSAFKEIIAELISISGKKSWLQESVWWSLILALDALHKSTVSWKEDAFQYVFEVIYQTDAQWSPEKVAVTLSLQDMQPDKDWRQFTAPTFTNPDVLSTSNLHNLAQILKDTDDPENAKSGGGSWKPDLHFVWTAILDHLLPLDGPAKGNFAEFFRIVVDESLFSSTSTPQRKYWGFQIFQKALPRLSEDVLPMIFTKNFMRTWINQLSKPDRYLHKAAKQNASDVAAFVKERPQLGMGLIVQLTGANGSPQFDKLTKTKTVENILSSMSAEGITHYVDHLIQQFNECDGIDKNDVDALNARRSWIIDQLVALVRNGSILKDDHWLQTVLEWLLVNGLFIVRKPSKQKLHRGTETVLKPPLSEELRATCRARLLSCLGDLTTRLQPSRVDGKPVRAVGVASNGEFWICRTLSIIEALQKDSKHITALAEVDAEDLALHTQVRTLDTQLQQPHADGAQNDSALGCRLLLSGLLIQEYCTDQESWNTEVLESCTNYAQHFVVKPKSKKSKKDKVDTESPAPIDGLVDALIGMLEKSSSYLRTLGNNAFSLLSGSVTETSIDLILAQLERRDPTQDEESDDEDMEEEVAESDREDGEEEAESESDDTDEAEEDEDEEEDEDAEVDEELRNKILEALKMNGVEPAGDSDDDDVEMDDDQMLALDDQLAEAFKSRMQERKSGKDVDAQREATHFKNRVLDLVDLFVKKQPTNPLVVTVILPLITLISSSGSDEKQLVDKAQGILRSRIGKSKDVPTSAPLVKVEPVLEALHTRVRKSRSDLSSTICACCIYLSKIMVSQQAEDKVVALYQATLEDFLTRKNSALTPVFFQDFITRFTSLAWRLRQPMLDLSSKAVNTYRQLQALRLVQSLLSNLHSIDKSDEEVAAFMTSLRKSLYGLVSNACDEKASLNVAQVKDVLKLALSALRQTLRLTSIDVDAVWAPKKWQKLSEKLIASPNLKSSPALPSLCLQIVQVATGKPAGKPKAGVKRKGDATSEATERKRQKKRPKT
ncbi:hypothetical protein BDZ89DRAFT_1056125 [Hymenopellis radicata]|nr:hypothetical protein BDZ89DRAFT_1056125 [Hymenopellis radicata]